MTNYFPVVDEATFCEHVADLAPVFTAPAVTPDTGQEEKFRRPAGWSTITRERNAERLASARAADARLALMGDLLAVVDVDTKNGADVERTRQLLLGIGVRIYAEVKTPSGGRHFYVAGHPELQTVGAQDGRDGLVGLPGVEILSHGRNAFLPGTKRPKYDGAGYEVISDDLGTLLDGGDPDSAEALAAWVAANRVRTPEAFTPAEPWSGKPLDHREQKYLEATLAGIYNELSTMGTNSGRNNALNIAAVKCGGYIAGAGMDEDRAVQMLRGACEANGLTAEDGQRSIDATIRSGLQFGKTSPRAVPTSKVEEYVTELVARDIDQVPSEVVPADADNRLEAEWDAAAVFAREVAVEAHKIRVREAAREVTAAERREPAPPFDSGLLSELLARPEEPPHRVEGLIPSEAGTLIVAMRKTGKTTLMLNLARCLVTGEDLLGHFATRPVAGKVALLNYEVSGSQIARWAAEVAVPSDRLLVVNLRGRRNPLSHPEDRETLSGLLREHDVESLIVDPFGRAYTGTSQNDSGEVGAWLTDLDKFARAEAGVADLILAAHAGWNGERSRGASALEDWADSIVTLVRDKDDDSQRYLKAEGRDVMVEEDRLDFDPATRMLSLSGGGSRTQAKSKRRLDLLVAGLVEAVTEKPGLKTNQLEQVLRDRGFGFQRGDVGKAGRQAAGSGHLRQEHGPGNSTLWFPTSVVLPSAPDTSRREHGSAPARHYRGGSTTTTRESGPGLTEIDR